MNLSLARSSPVRIGMGGFERKERDAQRGESWQRTIIVLENLDEPRMAAS